MTSTSTERRFGVNAGKAIKVPCKAASTGDLTLSGEQTIDGISCTESDRVLCKNQSDGTENGIYIVSTGSWSRAPDWDDINDVVQGTLVAVVQGTTNANTIWKVTTSGTITPGTTSVSLSLASLGSLGTSADLVTYTPGGAGAGITTVEARLRNYVSVIDYLATGDGVTDDTAAINAALTASQNVYFPPGTYLITSTITIGNGQAIYGAGFTSVTIKAGAAITMLNIQKDAYYWTVRDIRLDGDNTATIGILTGDGTVVTSNNGIGQIYAQVRNINGVGLDLRGTIFCDMFLYTQGNASYGVKMTLGCNINQVYLWSFEDNEGLYVHDSDGNHFQAALEKCVVGSLHITGGSSHNRFFGWFENVAVGGSQTYVAKIDGANTNYNTIYNTRFTASPGAIMDHIVVGDATNTVTGNVVKDSEFITVSSPTYAHVNLLNAQYTLVENNMNTAGGLGADREIWINESTTAGSAYNVFSKRLGSYSIVNVSTNYTATIRDQNTTLSVNASSTDGYTVTLPSAGINRGARFSISKNDSSTNPVIVAASSGSLSPSGNLTAQFDNRTYQSDGTNWLMITGTT